MCVRVCVCEAKKRVRTSPQVCGADGSETEGGHIDPGSIWGGEEGAGGW